MNNNNHSNRFMDGFLLGLLVGAIAVFLFGTKKGKGILKIISEQGLDGLTGLLEEYDLAEIEEDEPEEIKTPAPVKKAAENIAEKVEKVEEVVEEVKAAPNKKRFFKRIRR